MFLLFLISYYRKITINYEYRQFYILKSFGFREGGNFSIAVDKSQNSFLYIGIANSREINYAAEVIQTQANLTCNVVQKYLNIKLSKILDLTDGPDTFTGVIPESSVYHALLGSCQEAFSKYDIEIEFINPTSYLDSRKIPCLYFRPISVVLFGSLILFWLVNWIFNFTLKNPLHMYLTVTFLITFLYIIIDTFALFHQHKSHLLTNLEKVSITFRCFHEILLLTAMIMAAKGWCIIIESIEPIEIFNGFFTSLLFSLPILILDTVPCSIYLQLALFITGFLGCFLYYNHLVESITQANSVVSAHLLLISQSGIDPETTPIHKKYEIFKTISNTVVWYFTMMMFRTVLFELLDMPFYIMTIIYDLATFALLSTTAWLFKLKSTTRNGYMMVGQNTDSVEFTLDDIERLNDDPELQRQATTPWHEGMPLPSQPRINRNSIPNNDNSDGQNNENHKTDKNETENKEEEKRNIDEITEI
ncbi:hypothetical protein TRFO_28885 [Tritrichomonas foetus]|uniref:Intimal thickness related receptor IRP domain-containing protein n=1 Tax=Tritrichomonas foetus TaxID=1144522 RepID=A0A1J4JXB7_9EUKA|nr:hypothetical protein TRFO_28885 [Tritrichomonas foetus]|eukprot:OHT03635.1 hypothetical protein TRFO_28885 [Tritrichomonas foetus]